jgi:putative transposase
MAKEEFAVSYIQSVRKKAPGIGGNKLWYMYKRDFEGNKPLGRDKFEDIVNKYDLKVRKKMRKPKTTDSTHGLPLYPNLVKDFIPTAPNQLWVSDITYIPVWHRDNHYSFCYLSLILDAYSEEIVGWCVGNSLSTEYPLLALDKALSRLEGIAKEDVELIHHSDRGCQYASLKYTEVLKEHGIRISMTECGDPKENAQAERINNTMKNELLKDMRFTCIDDVVATVDAAVQFYNEERPHMSIDMKTPLEAASCTGEIRKRWTSFRQMYIKDAAGACIIPQKCLPLLPSPEMLLNNTVSVNP